jgi:protein FAM50
VKTKDTKAQSSVPNDDDISSKNPSTAPTPRSATPASGDEESTQRRRLGPNSALTVPAPKALTKSAMLREAAARESLRKEFISLQEAVKATDIAIPFVFYDGTNVPGGVVKVRKGDHCWLFLDRSRKVGAELGIGGAGEKASSARREWARINVDDLILVRGDVIIPHHHEFYYFIMNKNKGPSGQILFDFSATPTTSAPNRSNIPTETALEGGLLSKASRVSKDNAGADEKPDYKYLEGCDDDPTYTKVVDRRWYERNKHIFPASVWEDFDPERDPSKEVRRDQGGNAFFFG